MVVEAGVVLGRRAGGAAVGRDPRVGLRHDYGRRQLARRGHRQRHFLCGLEQLRERKGSLVAVDVIYSANG